MIVSIILAIVFLIFAIILLMGKGDMLIAGYNTASIVGVIVANTWAKKK